MSPASATRSPGRRLVFDRPVLVSCLLSGALWLLVPAGFGAWPLSLIGGVYVVAGGLFLGMAYAHDPVSWRQELAAWAVPWFGAVALWFVLIGGVGFADTTTDYVWSLVVGAVLGTLCFLGWQLLALAIRQAMPATKPSVERRSGRAA